MNSKEVSEIRRRFRADKSNINYIRGAFVNTKKEIISEFNQFLGDLGEDELSAILSVIKKALSGNVGRNLVDIPFSTSQVLEGKEHKLLCRLRDSELGDETAVREFFDTAVASVECEENYLILLAYDCYDVFSYSASGKRDEESTEKFSYIICCVCPIKESRSALTYRMGEQKLRGAAADTIVCPPEFGFMFPAFDDRATNIYDALYYTRGIADNHKPFIDAIFGSPAPMPAGEQKDTFSEVLCDSVGDDCDLSFIKSVNSEVRELIENHKEAREPEPLTVSKSTVKNILSSAGADDVKIEKFAEKFDEAFGKNTELPPQNIIVTDSLELRTSDVVIKVSPERADLVETRVIDGVKYILIRAENDVVVNGINVKIK